VWNLINKLLGREPELQPPATRDVDEVMQQLGMLRNLTNTMGIIHEAQKLQLDYWIRICVDDSIDHVIVPDLNATEKLIGVTFDVTCSKPPKGKKKEKIKQKLAIMNQWVKTLLGPDMIFRVKLHGQLLVEFGPESKKYDVKRD
jgi:hypothetical protein